MANNLENSKINVAIDLLIVSNVDLSNSLGEDGLIKQLSSSPQILNTPINLSFHRVKL